MPGPGPAEGPNPSVNDEQVKEILGRLPENEREVLSEALFVRQEMFAGPLPHPQSFKEYEEVLPGSADRILKMAEKQQEHRSILERSVVENNNRIAVRGQIFGFIVFILGIAAGVFFVLQGMKVFGGIFLTSTMVTLVGLFITGKVEIGKDLKEKGKDQQK